MTPISTSQTGTGRSTVLSLDNMADPFNVGLHYVASGTVTFNIEVSPQDPAAAAPTVWNAPSGLSGLSASGVQNTLVPSRAVSINVTAGTGSVTLYIVQAGLR